MKKHWKHKVLAAVLIVTTLSMTACESYNDWEARKEAEDLPDTYISTDSEYTGPNLADYVNRGLEEAKQNGLYTESDYSDIFTDNSSEKTEPDTTVSDSSENMSSSGQTGQQSDNFGNPNLSDEFGHAISEETLAYLTELEYEGEPYICINENIPYFTEEEQNITDAFEYYSDLDELGRTQYAFAFIDESLMPEENEERGNISSVKPSGWVQAKYDGIGNGNWLYNRCHLIAWSLAGENDNEQNLMTGTRYFNVEGMLPFEMQALEYLDDNPDNHLLYRATPVYEEDNLLAKGLLLEAESIEDDGELAFCVYIFNVQPGIVIDYQTGESHI